MKPYTPKLAPNITYGSNKGLEKRLVRKLTCANNGKLLGLSGNTNLLMAKKKVKHDNESSLGKKKIKSIFLKC